MGKRQVVRGNTSTFVNEVQIAPRLSPLASCQGRTI
jgi:hypothetical protein